MQRCKRRNNRKQKWCGQLLGGRRLSPMPFSTLLSSAVCICKGWDFFSLPTIALSEKILIKYSHGLIGMFLKNAVACRTNGQVCRKLLGKSDHLYSGGGMRLSLPLVIRNPLWTPQTHHCASGVRPFAQTLKKEQKRLSIRLCRGLSCGMWDQVL